MFGLGKIKCSKCGAENSKDDKFCSACGSNLLNTVCSGCGAKIGQGDKFCPECGSSITPIPAEDRSQETPVPMEEKIKLWSRKPDDFARRFELVDIKGTFRKHVTVEQGTKAIFLQGGRFMGELIPGTYDAGGLLKQIGNLNFSEKATVIVVDGSDTRFDFKIGNLRTKEAFAAGVLGILSINIEDPIMFFTNMMKSREYISVIDLTEFLVPEMTNIVQAKIKQYSFDDLYGNLELKNEIQQDFEYHMRITLNRLGMKLIHLPSFDYDEAYWSDLIKARGKVGLGEKGEDIKYKELELKKREKARAAEEEINKLNMQQAVEKYLKCFVLKYCGMYLFSWDEIPGNDNGRLIEFLSQKFGIDWVNTAKIEKHEGGKIINISVEKCFISLRLNEEKNTINMNFHDEKTYEFSVKNENGRLNIYVNSNKGPIIKGCHNIRFKTHDLTKLLKCCQKKNKFFEEPDVIDFIDTLQNFDAIRYPSQLMIDYEILSKLVDFAKKVRELIDIETDDLISHLQNGPNVNFSEFNFIAAQPLGDLRKIFSDKNKKI
jgi:hypothetical protein